MTATAPLRSLVTILAAGLCWASVGLAQDAAPQDEALDDLLKKLEQTESPDAKAKPDAADPAKGGEGSQGTTESKGKAGSDSKAKARPSGEVETKDQALDSLLEKLGETQEAPAPDDRRRQPGGPPQDGDPDAKPGPGTGPDQPKPKPGQPAGATLEGKAKDLDEHLEELTGRRRRKRDRDQQGEGEGSGPVSEIVKQIRDVEKRLSEPDTGGETQQRQKQIVQKLDDLIDQLRSAQGQGQGKGRLSILLQRQGQKPGPQGGPGAQGRSAQGTGPMKPSQPPGKHALANNKDEWGHLPAELRAAIENSFKEGPLPERIELIKRYYLSLVKKGQSREE